jgi:hypothetical protein
MTVVVLGVGFCTKGLEGRDEDSEPKTPKQRLVTAPDSETGYVLLSLGLYVS